mgnify:CR=1 FL=1
MSMAGLCLCLVLTKWNRYETLAGDWVGKYVKTYVQLMLENTVLVHELFEQKPSVHAGCGGVFMIFGILMERGVLGGGLCIG